MLQDRLRLLIVDDDAVDRMATRRALRVGSIEAEIVEAGAAEEALERLRAEPFDCVLLDLRLPGSSGLDVLKAARADGIRVPVVMLTGSGNTDTAVELMKAGAADYFSKDALDPQRLALSVRSAVRIYHAEEAAEIAHDQLLLAEEFQRQLIGIVGHDLRGPLQSIAMGAALFDLKKPLPEEKRTWVMTRISASAKRMERILDDLLDYTHARVSGKLSVTPREADLHPICEQIVAEMRATHPERTILYRAEGPGRGLWDPDRVAQVVQNLLSNALKYGAADSPVHLHCRGEDGERGRLRMTVRNGGEPIPKSMLPYIFEPFRRANCADENKKSLGLGLFIVKQIVDAHGGTISVQSDGQGTEFAVCLPLVGGA